MKKLKLLAVLFANIFLTVAIGLSVLQVEQFVLIYCVLQTIAIVFNVFIGVYFAVGPLNTQMQIDKNSMCCIDHFKMYKDGDTSCYLCGMSFSD